MQFFSSTAWKRANKGAEWYIGLVHGEIVSCPVSWGMLQLLHWVIAQPVCSTGRAMDVSRRHNAPFLAKPFQGAGPTLHTGFLIH